MAEPQTIDVTLRSRTGKGAARATRREGNIPGVLYGAGEAPAHVELSLREFNRFWRTGKFLSTIYMLNVEGTPTRVIPRDVQLDPVRDTPIHVDFFRISRRSRITVAVPVNFINEEEAEGLRKGGVLNVVRHEIDVVATAENLPDAIEVNLAGLEIGDSVHISAVDLPAGVRPAVTDRDFTIVTIAAPSALLSEEEEGEEGEDEFGEGEEGEDGEAEGGEEGASDGES